MDSENLEDKKPEEKTQGVAKQKGKRGRKPKKKTESIEEAKQETTRKKSSTGRPSAAKGIVIAKGSGTQLKDIPNDDNLLLLHEILFGKITELHNVKRNINQFSGIVRDENGEKQRTRIKEKLGWCIKEQLLNFCSFFDIPVKSSVKKDMEHLHREDHNSHNELSLKDMSEEELKSYLSGDDEKRKELYEAWLSYHKIRLSVVAKEDLFPFFTKNASCLLKWRDYSLKDAMESNMDMTNQRWPCLEIGYNRSYLKKQTTPQGEEYFAPISDAALRSYVDDASKVKAKWSCNFPIDEFI